MTSKYVDEDGIERLRVAIIAHSGRDYLYWKEKQYDLNKKYEDNLIDEQGYETLMHQITNELKKIATFFKSKWFQTLSEGDTNYERIILRLDEQHKYLMKEKERKKREAEERKRRAEERKRLKQSA